MTRPAFKVVGPSVVLRADGSVEYRTGDDDVFEGSDDCSYEVSTFVFPDNDNVSEEKREDVIEKMSDEGHLTDYVCVVETSKDVEGR